MRYAIIGDIHSNLEALQAVIQVSREEGVRTIICTGDIVGYGANPNECIDLIQQEKIICVAGNHDWAVCGKIDEEYFNRQAQEAVWWTQENLTKEHMEFLKNLELIYKNDDLVMVHGTLNQPQEFIYLNDPVKAMDTFYLMDKPICFVGHTHVPQILVRANNRNDFFKGTEIDMQPNHQYIVNVGGTGQPRDSNPTAPYGIYDPDLKRVSLKRVTYDLVKAQKKIFDAGLPKMLGQRLAVGQ